MTWFILAPLAVIATIVFCFKTLNLYYLRHKKRPLVRKLTPEEKRKMLEELHRVEEELEREERYYKKDKKDSILSLAVQGGLLSWRYDFDLDDD